MRKRAIPILIGFSQSCSERWASPPMPPSQPGGKVGQQRPMSAAGWMTLG